MSAPSLRWLSSLALSTVLHGALSHAQTSVAAAPAAQPAPTPPAAQLATPPAEAPAQPSAEAPASQPAQAAPAQPPAVSAAVLPLAAPAQPEQPASRAQSYREWAVALFGGAAFGTGFSPSVSTTVGPSLAAGAEVRVLYRGAVFSGSLGAQAVGVPLPAGPTAANPGALVAPGVGAGYSFALHPVLTLNAIARYNAQILFSSITSALHTITADVPLTIHVGSNGLIEPYVQGGVLIGGLSTGGSTGVSTQITGIFSGGARIGLRF